MTRCPHYMNKAAWMAAYDAEQAEITRHGWAIRRDAFNAEFPTPYTGPVTAASNARFAAICDASRANGHGN